MCRVLGFRVWGFSGVSASAIKIPVFLNLSRIEALGLGRSSELRATATENGEVTQHTGLVTATTRVNMRRSSGVALTLNP